MRDCQIRTKWAEFFPFEQMEHISKIGKNLKLGSIFGDI